MDQSIKSPQDVEKYFEIPCIGSIPKKHFFDAPVIRKNEGKTFYKRSYRTMADEIYLALKKDGQKSFLLASLMPREGTTTIIANIGLYLSRNTNLRVLIIDANLRSPNMHRILKTRHHYGLTDLLEGDVTFDKAIRPVGTTLSVMLAGKTKKNPLALLETYRMSEVIKLAREEFDLVLIDCANLKEYKDAIALSSFVDKVSFVINEGKSRRQALKSALPDLDPEKVNLHGVILNNRTYSLPKIIYDLV